MNQFVVLDEREIWHRPMIQAAKEFGYAGRRIRRGEEMPQGSLGFIRPHADPAVLRINQMDYLTMCARGEVLQDAGQMTCYENKTLQFERWGHWMPPTWAFTSLETALAAIGELPFPIVSKANEGASSYNVRIIETPDALRAHIEDVFAGRVMVNPCSSGGRSFKQSGYVLLQEFIPHEVTWRVNAIGNARGIFKRRNYPDRPVAQTGNTDPVKTLDSLMEALLDYADRVFADIKSKWCALDILHVGGTEFKLLETSLAWPWPSPGDCNAATLFRSPYIWIDMWRCMFQQYAEGAWKTL